MCNTQKIPRDKSGVREELDRIKAEKAARKAAREG
jgi:hypothetical protein